jgi:spore coat protein CotH
VDSEQEIFYNINIINNIDIIFERDNWDRTLDQLYAAGEEERLVGTALINGVRFDSVGVRYKGNSSYRANQIKNPLNIKLDHIISDQTLDGYGTLKLANAFKDPSFVREVLSYEIARKYLPASKANFAKVSINGTYLGLYTSVQSVDTFFFG